MSNKVIVITGATGGVGNTTVKHFLSEGWQVVGLAKNWQKLRQLSEQISTEKFHYFETDIKDYYSVNTVFKMISGIFPQIDVLINNAAIFKQKPFQDFIPQEIDDIIDTNVKGTMYCTLECIKIMRYGARIINIGSVSGIHGIANQAVYSASKYATNGFAESLNQELIPQGISISTICPGGIDTPLWNQDNPYDGDTEQLLKTTDITNMIHHIINLPTNVVLKNVIMFPTCEWH